MKLRSIRNPFKRHRTPDYTPLLMEIGMPTLNMSRGTIQVVIKGAPSLVSSKLAIAIWGVIAEFDKADEEMESYSLEAQ